MLNGQIGQIVAVKSHARVADVEHEAKMIMGFDHPGTVIILICRFHPCWGLQTMYR